MHELLWIIYFQSIYAAERLSNFDGKNVYLFMVGDVSSNDSASVCSRAAGVYATAIIIGPDDFTGLTYQ